jgi:hypothetical protein
MASIAIQSLCARRFLQFGLEAALGELPRPGKDRRIPDDAIAWVQHCACRKPKELGYAYELWTYSLLQQHVRKHCQDAGHSSLTELSRSRLHRRYRCLPTLPIAENVARKHCKVGNDVSARIWARQSFLSHCLFLFPASQLLALLRYLSAVTR